MIVDISSYTDLMNLIDSPVRQIKAEAEILEDYALVNKFTTDDKLKEFTVERIGDDSKFFGFGICQKINLKLIDLKRELEFSTAHSIRIAMGNEDYTQTAVCFPSFKISEVRRDEKTNELSITAYDKLYQASKRYTSELGVGDVQVFALVKNYTIRDFAIAIADLLGVDLQIPPEISSFDIFYEEGANYEGSETLREALDDIAEATQTIYYINSKDVLVFKRLDRDGSAVLGIDKNKYFTLESKTNRRLTGICHVTELGDNVLAQGAQAGTIQYVRDNPFWDLRDDIDTILENALAEVEGMTINQFDCNWRGNFLLEIGDKIMLINKDDEPVYSYMVNDTFEYNGAMSQNTKWHYSGDDETESNPSTLGDTLKQTFAKVDKINKEIDIVVSQTEASSSSIAQIQLDTENIKMSVKETEEKLDETIDNMNQQLAEITTKVEATLTSEDLKIEIEKQIQESTGLNKITTTTGFTFDEDGLHVSKSGSEMSTSITDNGMTVYRDNTAMLVANNQGVEAFNLKATTYLIIGTNSRFEDYGYNRTGCFWIGGN